MIKSNNIRFIAICNTKQQQNMEDETSNDVEMIYSDEDDESGIGNDGRPIMQLFKRLINGHDNKENTVLTNTQLLDLLQIELNVNKSEMHELEIDIYINLMKKFLKDWPLWDDLDTFIIKLKTKSTVQCSKQILNEKYLNLKKYLQDILQISRPLVKKSVEKAIKENSSACSSTDQGATSDATSDVVMDIQCSRVQLNQLFFRRPHPKYNNSIINMPEYIGQISLKTIGFESILNWPLVQVEVNLKSMKYKHSILQDVKRTLINKKCPVNQAIAPQDMDEMDTDLLEKNMSNANVKQVRKEHILKFITSIKEKFSSIDINITTIMDLMENDIKILPNTVNIGWFRKRCHKYPYLRYLYTDVSCSTESDKYDLQLEEKLSTTLEFFVKVDKLNMYKNIAFPQNLTDWLKVECLCCKMRFIGRDLREQIVEHFIECHQYEPDWHCSKCSRTFSMSHLAANCWQHTCCDL